MVHFRRSRRARLPIGTLVLLLAVFGWGLGYKISLYGFGKPSHAASPRHAKLLTEAERCAAEKRSAHAGTQASTHGSGSAQAFAAEGAPALKPARRIEAIAKPAGRMPLRGFDHSQLRAPPRA